MDKQNNQTNSATQNLPESPASVNTRIKSARGFIYQWTMRDEKNSNLFFKIKAMEEQWIEHGFTPVEDRGGFKKFDPPPRVTKMCTIHNVEMTQKASKKSGKLYFSHYIGQYPNGITCFGEDQKLTTQAIQTPPPPQEENYSLDDIDF